MIREITKNECIDLARVAAKSYPGAGSGDSFVDGLKKWLEKITEECPNERLIGYFDGGKLIGGLRLIDFKMNVRGKIIDTQGIGLVCVDLLHKKEKIAKKLLEYTLKNAEKEEVKMMLLDPFNVQFYKNMGFGYGTKVYKYMVKPNAFPRGDSKKNLLYLNKEDHRELVRKCYNRVHKNTHGLIERQEFDLNRLFSEKNIIIGYMKDNQLLGYLAFSFNQVKDNYTYMNNMIVKELIYENQEGLEELCTFVHSQLDQVERVIMEVNNEFIEFILSDPTNGLYEGFNTNHCEVSVTGIGKMYRVLKLKSVMEELKDVFSSMIDFKIKLNVHDNFMEEGKQSVILSFENGKGIIRDGAYDVEVSIDVSDFSSLIMGVIPFNQLMKYGRVGISDSSYLSAIDSIFTQCSPVCLTEF